MAHSSPGSSNTPAISLSDERREKLHVIYSTCLRIREHILRGEMPEQAWKGSNEPTVAQVRTLLVLNRVGPCTLKTLAQALDVSGASASAMVDKLVEAGYVLRAQDPADRRRVTLQLTEDAHKRVSCHECFVEDHFRELVSRIGDDCVNKWVEVSLRIREVLDELSNERGHETVEEE